MWGACNTVGSTFSCTGTSAVLCWFSYIWPVYIFVPPPRETTGYTAHANDLQYLPFLVAQSHNDILYTFTHRPVPGRHGQREYTTQTERPRAPTHPIVTSPAPTAPDVAVSPQPRTRLTSALGGWRSAASTRRALRPQTSIEAHGVGPPQSPGPTGRQQYHSCMEFKQI